MLPSDNAVIGVLALSDATQALVKSAIHLSLDEEQAGIASDHLDRLFVDAEAAMPRAADLFRKVQEFLYAAAVSVDAPGTHSNVGSVPSTRRGRRFCFGRRRGAV